MATHKQLVKEVLEGWHLEHVLEYSSKDKFKGIGSIVLKGGHRLIPTGCGTGFKLQAKIKGAWKTPLYIPFD